MIFGYLAVTSLLFFPCNRVYYKIDGEKIGAKVDIVFAPFYFSSEIRNEYLKFKEWNRTTTYQSVADRLISSGKTVSLGRIGDNRPSPQVVQKKEEEFRNKFGASPYYYKINFMFFIAEIMVLMLIAGFAYILFCVVLRKDK